MILRDLRFKKRCNGGKLTQELKKAGFKQYDPTKPSEPFDFYGVSVIGDETIVHMADDSPLDPTPVVNAHDPTPRKRYRIWLKIKTIKGKNIKYAPSIPIELEKEEITDLKEKGFEIEEIT